jgi:hypothetical protein
MNDHALALLICLAVILLLAALLYSASRGQVAALTTICDVRQTLRQIMANTEKIDQSLDHQRPVLNDAHKRIYAVTKGAQKAKP